MQLQNSLGCVGGAVMARGIKLRLIERSPSAIVHEKNQSKRELLKSSMKRAAHSVQ